MEMRTELLKQLEIIKQDTLVVLNLKKQIEDEKLKIENIIENEKLNFILEISKMNKDEIKSLGSNQEIRDAKISESLKPLKSELYDITAQHKECLSNLDVLKFKFNCLKTQVDILTLGI